LTARSDLSSLQWFEVVAIINRSPLPIRLRHHPHPQVWRSSSFAQRRLLLKILLKYIINHQEQICRSVADDGCCHRNNSSPAQEGSSSEGDGRGKKKPCNPASPGNTPPTHHRLTHTDASTPTI